MGKRGFFGTVAVAGLGAVAVLAIGEAREPGSSTPIVQAGTNAGANVIRSSSAIGVEAINGATPILQAGMGAVQNSGIGNMLSPNGATTNDPTAVPPAGATPDTTP